MKQFAAEIQGIIDSEQNVETEQITDSDEILALYQDWYDVDEVILFIFLVVAS